MKLLLTIYFWLGAIFAIATIGICIADQRRPGDYAKGVLFVFLLWPVPFSKILWVVKKQQSAKWRGE